jgi:hypothetical protein
VDLVSSAESDWYPPILAAGTTPDSEMTMKKLACAAAVTGALAAVVLAAPATAAPAGVGTAQDTIRTLQAQGYHVIVNKLGTAPLERSTVVAVRPGQTYSRTDSGFAGDDLTTVITGKTIYVDVS